MLPIITLKNITLGYEGASPILQNFSCAIHGGETVHLMGDNGCGKTTLLKLLNGLLLPLQGQYIFQGTEVSRKLLQQQIWSKTFHQKIGYLWQKPESQLFCSTVEEELAFGPLQMGLNKEKIQHRVQDTLELLGIEHLRERTPYTLSGGEQKKTAIGAILTMNPTIWILDEPMNDLDRQSQNWLIDFLTSLKTAGKTIIFTSHHQQLNQIADRSIILG